MKILIECCGIYRDGYALIWEWSLGTLEKYRITVVSRFIIPPLSSKVAPPLYILRVSPPLSLSSKSTPPLYILHIVPPLGLNPLL